MLNWLRARRRRAPGSRADTGPDPIADPAPWSWHDLDDLRRRAAEVRCPGMPRTFADGDVIGPATAQRAWVVRGGVHRIGFGRGAVTLRHLVFLDGARCELGDLSRITFEGCVFLDGDGTQRPMVPTSGAIEAKSCLVRLRGCLLAGNRGAYGGAVHVRRAARLDASHCVFVDNFALSGGGAIAVEDTSSAHLRHCSLVANQGGAGSALACHGTIFDVGEARLERCAVIAPPATDSVVPGAAIPSDTWHHATQPDRVTAIDCLLPPGTVGLAPASSGNRLMAPTDPDCLRWPYALGEADQGEWSPSAADAAACWFDHRCSDRIGAVSTRTRDPAEDPA